MPRFAANLGALFTEVDVLDRFDAAARAGFGAVEIGGAARPYDYPAEVLQQRLRAAGLKQVALNMPSSHHAGGGLALRPDTLEEFRANVLIGIRYAQALGCDQLICGPGGTPPDIASDIVRRTLLDNLRFGARACAAQGIRFLVEPISTVLRPDEYLSRTGQTVELVEEVGDDNLFIECDTFHMQLMEGDLARTFERHLRYITHIQIADAPGRHEPGTGEINFSFLLDHLDRIGYRGWIACEYRPLRSTRESLVWLEIYRRSQAK